MAIHSASMKAMAGGLIAIGLLVLYSFLVGSAIAVVNCTTQIACTLSATDFNAVEAQTMSMVGGLVSALVISELALTRPGQAPGVRGLSGSTSDRARNVLRWVTALYILVWFVVGGMAFLTGLKHPDTLPALTSLGQAWFGLSVASAYAYFGLSPS